MKIAVEDRLCLKTREEGGGGKVFVNVCTSDALPAPENITEEELIKILESDEPSDFRFGFEFGWTCSVADPCKVKAGLYFLFCTAGEDCVAYDVVVSPEFFSRLNDSPLFHNFFVIASMEGIEEKYSITLDKNGWTVLKNKKYHGNLSDQTVLTTLPMVQELSAARHWKPSDVPASTTCPDSSSASLDSPKSPAKPLISEVSTKIISEKTDKKIQPCFTLSKSAGEGGMDDLVAEVELPSVVTGQKVEVNVGEDRLVVEAPRNLLDVFVPVSLDSDKAKAFFITSSKVPCITKQEPLQIRSKVAPSAYGTNKLQAV
ncbi:PIH1 domain-containing protein 1 [Portunus trituberculatus]|uniref:PIH1 domain-containing protein 1 n=1 Tax=Portunus trituberculatus TaxID=210409 RepID=A0A5B7EV29_PORTR|nr:PIH1 domain-containing protein 1 [Portunus trituberculatus]